jgi:ribonuclease HII
MAFREMREKVMLRYERDLWSRGLAQVAGIDEAGRGPLAGPVVAAAVIFPPNFFIPDVNDSKQLSAVHRSALFDVIMTRALAVGVGIVGHEIIDQVNILNATYLAMHRAIRRLSLVPDYLLVDGNRFLSTGIPFATIVRGDASSFSIAAASIIAKVARDRMMVEYDMQFPGYGFAKHKGYATSEHREAIKKLGYSDIHRRSFRVR